MTTDSAIGRTDEWRLGWTLTVASAVGLFVGVTHLYTMGVFIGPLEREFGWSRTEITSGLTIVSLVAVLGSPFIGLLIDQIGPRRVGLTGVMAYCAAFALLSLAGPSVWSWWAIWTLLAIASLGTKSTIWTAGVATSFDRSRGMAIAVVLCGASAGSAVLPTAAHALVDEFGWRAAYAVLGGAMAVVTSPLLYIFFRTRRPVAKRLTTAAPDSPVGAVLRESLLSFRYLRLALSSFFVAFGITALAVHFIPMLTAKGVTPGSAAALAGVIGVSSVCGRIGAGFLLDRFSGPLIGLVSFAAPIIACAALLLSPQASAVHAVIAAMFIGASLGAEIDVIVYLTSRYFSIDNFGTLFGTLAGIMILATGLGPLALGSIYDSLGSYDRGLMLLAPLFALSACLVGTLGPYPARASAARHGEGKTE